MCFFVYAPNQHVEIEFLSELIQLQDDGTSVVKSDFLIANTSDQPIETVRILYPNKFYTVLNGNVVLNDSKFYCKDLSNSFIDDPEEINWTYKLPGTSVHILPSNQANDILSLPQPIPSWANYRIFEQTDPSSIQDKIRFEGIVGGTNDLSIEQSCFTYTQYKIMNTINYTLITYKFSQPLYGHARWIRLIFKGKNAAHNLNAIKHKAIRKFSNGLYYQYQILGPHDVNKNFKNYLLAYKIAYEKKGQADIGNNIISLLHFFEQDGLICSDTGQSQASTTLYKKVFIHVSPGKMGRLTDFTDQGKVKIAGFLPNSGFTGEKNTINIYQWKSINESNDNPFYFALMFQAKPFNIIFLFLPFIFSLIAITIGILNALSK